MSQKIDPNEKYKLNIALDGILHHLSFAESSFQRAKHDELLYPPYLHRSQGQLNAGELDIQNAKREWIVTKTQYASLLTTNPHIQQVDRLFRDLLPLNLRHANECDQLISLLRQLKR